MILDISKIANDKINEMDRNGEIKSHIEGILEKAVKESISDALGGYAIRKAMREEMEKGLPDIVESIGLSAYNTLVAETAAKIVRASLEGDAQGKVQDAVKAVLDKKQERAELSEIIGRWKNHIDDIEDRDEAIDLNESHDGYSCILAEKKASYGDGKIYSMYLDKMGDAGYRDNPSKDDYDIAIDFSWQWHPADRVRIRELYFSGIPVRKEFIHHAPSRFEAFLLNLYFNETEIVLDTEKYDEDDHYYTVEGD